MQKITPFIWFDSQAEEAAHFYISLFKNSKMGSVSRYPDKLPEGMPGTPGAVMTASFTLNGLAFGAINGGPMFPVNPSISFFVGCNSEEEIDRLWAAFSDGGKVLMELDAYPFSKKYGWIQDRYGISWQLIMDGSDQLIRPSLLFVGAQAGKAKEAIELYTSLFENSSIKAMAQYEAGEGTVGHLKYASFTLDGLEFAAMDSDGPHQFTFNEGISLAINTQGQEESDKFWNKLTADGGEESQCGWLKDKFGVSRQVVPSEFMKLMGSGDPVKTQRTTQAMMTMKKLDIAALQKAYDGA